MNFPSVKPSYVLAAIAAIAAAACLIALAVYGVDAVLKKFGLRESAANDVLGTAEFQKNPNVKKQQENWVRPEPIVYQPRLDTVYLPGKPNQRINVSD